jgi:1,4-alpha-glucan branching enzyme
MSYRIFEYEPYLLPFEKDIIQRMKNYKNKKNELLAPGQKLIDFANGHMFYGFHKAENGWYYREWAPAAEAVYLTGDFNSWNRKSHPLTKKENGVWELFLSGRDSLKNGQKVMTIIVNNGKELDRIPLYANYVVQEPGTIEWNAEIHVPDTPFK